MKNLICLLFLFPLLPTLAQQTGPQLPYQVVKDWAKLPAGWYFGEVVGVDVDKDDNVWVFSRGKHPIIQFDRSGNLLQDWSEFPAAGPHALRVGPEGNIWTVDPGEHHVMKSSPEGRLLMILGRHPAADTESFNRPTSVALAPNGHIYVADSGNRRVMKFNKDGEYLLQWGTQGNGPGQFAGGVHDVALDAQGMVYVTDGANHRIQIFDQNGTFLDEWTGLGTPHAVYYDERESVFYVCETGLSGVSTPTGPLTEPPKRVLKVDLDGKVMGVLASYGKVQGKVDLPHYVAVDSAGAVYVAELNNWRVQKFVNEQALSAR